MPTNILEAAVRLYSDDSGLRSSFQALAPQAHLAGIAVGDRFAAGMKKAAEAAHAAFQKDFIGPLQAEALSNGPGRGMEARGADQYRASDLARHKAVQGDVREHVERLNKIRDDATPKGGFWRSLFEDPERGPGESGGGSGGEGGGHGVAAEAAHIARIFAHTVTPALSQLNPAMAEFIQAGAQSARTAIFFGVAMGGAAVAGSVLSSVLGHYIERAHATTESTFQISQALKTLDASRAEGEFRKATEEIDRVTLAWDQLTGKVKATPLEKIIAGAGVVSEKVADAAPSLLSKGLSLIPGGNLAVDALLGPSKTTANAEIVRLEKLLRDVSANVQIAKEITLPKAQAEARVFNAGLLEREAQLNIRNAKSVEDLNAAYDKSVKSIHDRTDAEIDGLQTQLEADRAASKTEAAKLKEIKLNEKLGAQRADLTAKERERTEALVRAENEREAHAVQLGRLSMQADLEFQRGAASDPRRTLGEQQAAETKVFELRRSMAEEYFKLQGNLGKSMWKEQLEVARGFLSETVEGSQAWFNQTQKIFDLYKNIREEARGVFSQQVGIGESEASRQGKTSISLDDLPDLLRNVRERDAGALRGDRVRIGDLSGAVGRMDLFRQIDREGLNPREAFSRLMEDPSKQLARILGDVTGTASGLGPALSELGNAANQATAAILAMAAAAGRGGEGPLRRNPGGPDLSDSNRGAILATNRPDARPSISTDVDSELGRNLFLSAQRGPATTPTMP